MATIADIVRETGLGRTTVAEALRGKPGYSQSTQQRVRECAKRLGYRPNYLSKALNGGKSMSIGVIWPMRGVTGDVDVAMAVLEEARFRGYTSYQAEYSPEVTYLRGLIHEFADRRIDGLLMWGECMLLEELIEDLNAIPAVVALSDGPVDGLAGDQLVLDRLSAIGQVVDHWAAGGRRRPAIVLSDRPSQHRKIHHFMDRCRHHGMRVDESSLIDLEPYGARPRTVGSADPVFDKPTLCPGAMGRYRRAYESRFRHGIDVDALLCGTDQGALAALRFFEDQGLKAPDDVAVVGWNNIPSGSIWRPALATIDRAQDQTIAALRDLLLGRLESPDLPPRRRTVEMEFVRRESAGRENGIDTASRPPVFRNTSSGIAGASVLNPVS